MQERIDKNENLLKNFVSKDEFLEKLNKETDELF